jgi:hypothetical protein
MGENGSCCRCHRPSGPFVALLVTTLAPLPAVAQDFLLSRLTGEAHAAIHLANPGFPDPPPAHDALLPPLDTVAFAEVKRNLGGVFNAHAAAFQSAFGINATFAEVTDYFPEITGSFEVTASTHYQVEVGSTSDLTGQPIPFEFVINGGELRIEDFAQFEPFAAFGGAFVTATINILFSDVGGIWQFSAHLTKDEATGLPIVREHLGNMDEFGLDIFPTLTPFMDGADAVVTIPEIHGTVMLEGEDFGGGIGVLFDYDMEAMVQMVNVAFGNTGALAGITDPFALGTPEDPSDDRPGLGTGVSLLLNGQPFDAFPVIVPAPPAAVLMLGALVTLLLRRRKGVTGGAGS